MDGHRLPSHAFSRNQDPYQYHQPTHQLPPPQGPGNVFPLIPSGHIIGESTELWDRNVWGENRRIVATTVPQGLPSTAPPTDLSHNVDNLEASLRSLLLKNQEADNALLRSGGGATKFEPPTGPSQHHHQHPHQQPFHSRGHFDHHHHHHPPPPHAHQHPTHHHRGFGRRGYAHPPPPPAQSYPDGHRQYDPRFSGQDVDDFPPLGATPSLRPVHQNQPPHRPPSPVRPSIVSVRGGSFKRGRGMNLDYVINAPVHNNRAGRGHPRYYSDGSNGGRGRGRGRGRGVDHHGKHTSSEKYTPIPITKGPHSTNYDYLRDLALAEVKKNDPDPEEEKEKVRLLAQLQKLCENVVPGCRVVPFGSLVTGFAGTKADFDLLLVHDTLEPALDSLDSRVPVYLAGEFLRRGFDKVALLTKTRVPILKITTPEHNGKQQDEWAKRLSDDFQKKLSRSRSPSRSRRASIASTASDASFNVEVHKDETWPPGISCDIGFTKHLGIRNSEMLKTYSLCDPRVRQLVMFVKNWAKRRKINSAYRGTLSSYGYVLLTLHFLMNVTQPAILPNLQLMLPRPGTPQHEITSPEGFDIYFFNDRAELAKLVANNAITANKLSLGQLINDFFDYYSHTFRWHIDVISLRTRGGILSKQEKGWTSAVQRTSKLQGLYKDRYLIGIEDPFEITHNVGRPCFNRGAQTVKMEFQRASSILNELSYIDPLNPSIPPTTATAPTLPTTTTTDSESSLKQDIDQVYKTVMDKLLEQRETEVYVQEETHRIAREKSDLQRMVRKGVTTGEMKMMTSAARSKEKKEAEILGPPIAMREEGVPEEAEVNLLEKYSQKIDGFDDYGEVDE